MTDNALNIRIAVAISIHIPRVGDDQQIDLILGHTG